MNEIAKRGLLSLALLIGMAFSISAQTVKTKVTVTKTNDNEVVYTLDESDYLTFNEGQSLVVNISGSTQVIALSTIRKVVFEKIIDGIDEIASEIKIMPNPANDSFRVSNLDKDEDMTIYSMTGQKVMDGIVSNDQTIDISALANGLYLVKIGSQTTKLMKR